MKRLGPVVGEARTIVSALRDELDRPSVGPLLVTGMLAEQLARQLGEGADPGAVVAGDASRVAHSAAVVHIIAGEPTPADEELVHDADHRGVPVVLVQLWPQADWTRPFVLTPFVVECRAGEGFPVREISRRVVEAVEDPVAVARRIPVLQDAVARSLVGATAIRAAILGAVGKRSRAARPLITLDQLRMLAGLRMLRAAPAGDEALKSLAPFAAAAVGAGFLLRGAARSAQGALPAPVANALVAAAGTWLLGEAFRRLERR